MIQHRESQDHKALFNTLSFHPANDPALTCTLQSPTSVTGKIWLCQFINQIALVMDSDWLTVFHKCYNIEYSHSVTTVHRFPPQLPQNYYFCCISVIFSEVKVRSFYCHSTVHTECTYEQNDVPLTHKYCTKLNTYH